MATPRTTRQLTPGFSKSASHAKRSGSSATKPSSSKHARHRDQLVSLYTRSAEAVIETLRKLKGKLMDDALTEEVLDDFFDKVITEPAFCPELSRAPRWLSEAIARSAEDILDKPTGASVVLLAAACEYDLVYGSVEIDSYTGTAVYFDDLQLGVVGLYPEQEWREPLFIRLIMVDEPLRRGAEPN